ncbi:hypothetical protein ACFO9Q_17435 [Paenibacillus sp. GCM10023252]
MVAVVAASCHNNHDG